MGQRGPLRSPTQLRVSALTPSSASHTHSLPQLFPPRPLRTTGKDEQMESSDPGPYSQLRGPGPERGPQGGRVHSARYPGLLLLGPHSRTVCRAPPQLQHHQERTRTRAHPLSRTHIPSHSKIHQGETCHQAPFFTNPPRSQHRSHRPPSTGLKGTGAPTLSWPWPRGGTSSRVDQARSAWC